MPQLAIDATAIGQCVLLLVVANGAPIVARKLFGERFGQSLDGGVKLADGRPLFGPAKTLRGLLAAVVASALTAALLGLSLALGALLGLCAMLGDLLSSFVKRRLAIPASGMALGLDQIPESLLPLLALRPWLTLSWEEVLVTVLAFVATDVAVSRLLFRLHIRKRPY